MLSNKAYHYGYVYTSLVDRYPNIGYLTKIDIKLRDLERTAKRER